MEQAVGQIMRFIWDQTSTRGIYMVMVLGYKIRILMIKLRSENVLNITFVPLYA